MKAKFLLLPIAFFFANVYFSLAQAPKLTENAKITVLTCGSGNELYSVFGHTAIRVSDPQNNIDTVFNYGTFDFDTSFFYLKFMYGNLQYFLSTSNYDDFVYQYQISNRSVFEQELIINSESKQKIFNRLYTELNSDKKYYTYQFIERNCTTKATDILIEYIPKNNIKESYSNSDELSYRGIINNYLTNHYFEKLGINILFGLKTDQLAENIFLPEELMASLTVAETGGKNITPGTQNIYIKSDDDAGFVWWNNMFIIFGLFLIVILIKKQKYDVIFLKVFGWIGVFILLFSFISQHHEVSYNINILIFNPILLYLARCFEKNNEDKFKKTTWVLLLMAVIFIFKTLNTASFYILTPFIIPLAFIIYRLPFYKTKIDDDEMIQNAVG